MQQPQDKPMMTISNYLEMPLHKMMWFLKQIKTKEPYNP